MRTILCIMLVLACFQSAPAQHFDIWDYVTHPREETATFPNTFTTQAQARAYVQARVPVHVREQVDDYLPMVTVKLALLSHYPNTNAATQALLAAVVPQGETVTDEIRYLAALKREIQLGYPALYADAATWGDPLWQFGTRNQYIYRDVGSFQVSQWLSACYKRAVQIVVLMQTLETYQMPALAADVHFVRDSARVKLKEQNGFRLTAGRQNLYLTVRSGASRVLFAPLRSVDCRSLHLIQRGTASTATCNIVPQGPVLIKVGTAAAVVQAKDVLRTLTDSELGLGVKIEPLDVPVVSSHLSNQTFEVASETSVDYSGVFSGERLTYAVTSSQESVCTVRLGAAGILVVRAVSAGNSTVTVTATNEAGSAVSTFIATVTPRSN